MSIDKRERCLELDGRSVSYRLERRPRRSLTMLVEPRQGLRVLAPRRMSLREIDRILAGESDWLRRQLAGWEAWERKHPPRSFRDGDYLPLLGENWRLSLREEVGRRRPLIRHESNPRSAGMILLTLPSGLDEASRRELAGGSLQRWYRRLARRLIEARIEHWAPIVGARPKKIGIRDTRSRWGSCSGSGTISFCWRIVLAHASVIDYLVVHELCHLHHLDHSPSFWKEVERVLPDSARARKWLRDHGEELYL